MKLETFAANYLQLLTGPLEGLNLTKILNPEEFFTKQVLDSILPFQMSPVLKSILGLHDLVIDVGFGGGFPLFPLAIEFSTKKIVGIESIGKKVSACTLIRDSLGLSNIHLINNRLEKILIDRHCLITFKAVGKISDLLNFINVAAGCKVSVVFYKGPSFRDELYFKNSNWSCVEIFEYLLADNSARSTLLYENVPRGTLKNKKLVKLSELILE